MKFIIPIILIGTSIAVFVMFTSPIYSSTDVASPGIGALKTQIASLNTQLDNYQTFDGEKEKLTTRKNGFDPEDLTRLAKLLPDSVDNIRLILEIEKIAEPYGMVLRDVKYDATKPTSTSAASEGTVVHGDATAGVGGDVGTWSLQFSTTANYSNFLNFLKDLESNLRIVDVSSIQFSSTDTSSNSGNSNSSSSSNSQVYRYTFNIKTYWLKN